MEYYKHISRSHCVLAIKVFRLHNRSFLGYRQNSLAHSLTLHHFISISLSISFLPFSLSPSLSRSHSIPFKICIFHRCLFIFTSLSIFQAIAVSQERIYDYILHLYANDSVLQRFNTLRVNQSHKFENRIG